MHQKPLSRPFSWKNYRNGFVDIGSEVISKRLAKRFLKIFSPKLVRFPFQLIQSELPSLNWLQNYNIDSKLGTLVLYNPELRLSNRDDKTIYIKLTINNSCIHTYPYNPIYSLHSIQAITRSPYRIVAGDSLQCTPLDRAYKSKVLGHYPESVSWNPFDEHAVCMVSARARNSPVQYRSAVGPRAQ